MSEPNTTDPKQARPDQPIHELLAARWSPYGFTERMPPVADLRAVFEAARWTASSYNEQPWRYIVATREQPREFERILACLVEANQAWARSAPVLALGVAALEFVRNGKPNRAAVHDLGAASAALTFEATARGLFVHQMIGIEPDTARETFAIPAGFEAYTGLAIGYRAEPDALPEKLRERDLAPRGRRPQSEFVFGGSWDEPAALPGE